MTRVWRSVVCGCLSLAFVAVVAAPARANWTIAAFLGTSFTAAPVLVLERSATGERIRWAHVRLDSRSFEAPPYYGYRILFTPSAAARLGLEAELIHLKVYAATGALAPAVERFSMSHGLNLLLANVVWRKPLTRVIRLAARGGAGVAIPHAESVVAGVESAHYEITSIAVQAAGGPEFSISRWLRAFAEYKLTTTAPSVTVAGGRISGRYTSQHLATGLGVEW